MSTKDMIPIKVTITITFTEDLDPNDYPDATTIEEKLKLFKEDIEDDPRLYILPKEDTIEVVVTQAEQ
jgi:hypothetical protein